MDPQKCPICGVKVERSSRYPRYVCRECAARARSIDGRPLEFSNADAFGGFVARYRDSGAEYSSHECYVDGVPCYADEARFGGIVIQVRDRTASQES